MTPEDVQYPVFSKWADAPAYYLDQDLHQSSERTSKKDGIAVRRTSTGTFFFYGLSHWTGSELIQQRGTGIPPTSTAYTKNNNCDTYGITIGSNPAVRLADDGSNIYYVAQHVFEWRLLKDLWDYMMSQFIGVQFNNPSVNGFKAWTFPTTAKVVL
jgi:hypothetical protein